MPSRGRPACWPGRSASAAPSSHCATWGGGKRRDVPPFPTTECCRDLPITREWRAILWMGWDLPPQTQLSSLPQDHRGTLPPGSVLLIAMGSQRDPPPPGSAFPIAVGYQTKTNPLPSLSLPHQSGISDRPPPQSQLSPRLSLPHHNGTSEGSPPQPQLSQSLWDPTGTPSPGSEPPSPIAAPHGSPLTGGWLVGTSSGASGLWRGRSFSAAWCACR